MTENHKPGRVVQFYSPLLQLTPNLNHSVPLYQQNKTYLNSVDLLLKLILKRYVMQTGLRQVNDFAGMIDKTYFDEPLVLE